MNGTLIAIYGPESSGTKIVTEIVRKITKWKLIEDDIWTESEESRNILSKETVLITRRSIPHGAMVDGRVYYNPASLYSNCLKVGFKLYFIFTVRDQTCMLRSKTRVHTRGDFEMAQRELDVARQIMKESIRRFSVSIVSLESLIFFGPIVVSLALKQLGLDYGFDDIDLDIYDANRKYLFG